jgi:tetratricopeptide (TPR) repeat protein
MMFALVPTGLFASRCNPRPSAASPDRDAGGAVGHESRPTRPDGLEGIAVARTSTPSPLRYFETHERAHELAASDHFAEAEPLVDQLVSNYPFDGHNWLLAGRVKRRLGKLDEAVSAYRKAMALLGPGVPGSAEYWVAASEALGEKTDGALETLEHLVAADAYGHRPSLYDDDHFKNLRALPAFAAIAGHVDSAAWTRDDGWRHDVDYLVAEVKRVNPDYHDRSLPMEFERLRRELLAAVPTLSDEQIYVGMSRMLASLNQGHTNMWPFVHGSRMAFTALPVQLYVFPEGVFVVAASAGNENLIGTELTAIEGTPALAALQQIKEIHAADSGMEVVWLGAADLTLAQELKGLGIAPRTDRIAITLRMPSGATVTRTLATTFVGGPPKLPAAAGHPPALAFRNLDKAHWLAPLPEARALYVQVNRILDDPDETLEAFGVRVRGALKDDQIRNVILDLRNDNGGNTFTYVELLRSLIAFSQGEGRRLYVLIGRAVYSAAANLVTDLERLASPVFIGEPTSMTGNNYGDESEVVLPYSGIAAGVAGVRWQLGYPSDARRSIVPQVPVAMTAADYFAGRDPALETAESLCMNASSK